MNRTPDHLSTPEQIAASDFADPDRDIGFNRYPYQSAYWHRYRIAYQNAKLNAMWEQYRSEPDPLAEIKESDHVDPAGEQLADYRQGGEE